VGAGHNGSFDFQQQQQQQQQQQHQTALAWRILQRQQQQFLLLQSNGASIGVNYSSAERPHYLSNSLVMLPSSNHGSNIRHTLAATVHTLPRHDIATKHALLTLLGEHCRPLSMGHRVR
jgi:hypothetical protein